MGGGASKQRVATLKRHTGWVKAVASYTTQAGAVRVVSGSSDKTITIWDPETQRLLATLQGHTDWVRAVASYTTQAGAGLCRVARDRAHPIGVPLQRGEEPLRFRVPDRYGLVARAAHDAHGAGLCRVARDRFHPTGVPFQRGDALLAGTAAHDLTIDVLLNYSSP